MTEMLTIPFDHPAAWTCAQMAGNPEWSFTLTPAHVAEVKAAVRHAVALQRPLLSLSAADFPLPTLGPRFVQLRQELEEGRGFELWRGLDVPDWTVEERTAAFWGLGMHLGAPIVQNSRGELLGHVMNTTSTDPSSNANLIPLLYEPLWFDHRGERNAQTGEPYWVTSICGWANGKLSMMYLRNFIESGQRYPGAPPLTERHRELFDLIDRLAHSEALCLSMDFQPGDIQWLNNHTTLHSRTSFEDYDEPERRRWLLRLWLNFAERNRFTETYGFYGIAVDDAVA